MARFPLSRLMLLLLVLAFALRSMVPMGYMPHLNSGKIFHITICTLEGPKTVALDERMQPVGDSEQHKGEAPHEAGPCAFALANTTIAHAVPDGVPPVPVIFPEITAHAIRGDTLSLSTAHHLAAQPRAPPVLS